MMKRIISCLLVCFLLLGLCPQRWQLQALPPRLQP